MIKLGLKCGKIYIVKVGLTTVCGKLGYRLGDGFQFIVNPRWEDHHIKDEDILRLASKKEVDRWKRSVRFSINMYLKDFFRNEQYYSPPEFKY